MNDTLNERKQHYPGVVQRRVDLPEVLGKEVRVYGPAVEADPLSDGHEVWGGVQPGAVTALPQQTLGECTRGPLAFSACKHAHVDPPLVPANMHMLTRL